MIELFNEKMGCCGCGACKNSCPKQAILMKSDEEGFQYPFIETALCTECGLCKSVCPFSGDYIFKDNLSEPDVYAVKHVSEDVRLASSSGGVFTAISDFVLDNHGIVIGAAFDENFDVCHKAVYGSADRDALRGSKYVQSDLKESFLEAKKALTAGRIVLFSGTPCQNAGLNNYLGNSVNKENLYLCDVVCHGVPSPKMFHSYKDLLERKYNSEISSINFRYKPAGWRSQTACISFKSGAEYCKSAQKDVYYKLFISNLILRPSCYHCKFATIHRPSDITIADFWGIEKCIPEIADDRGVSLVLINSEKGRRLFGTVKNQLEYKMSYLENCEQPNMKAPCEMPQNRDAFWEDYLINGFEHSIKIFAGASPSALIKAKIREIAIKLNMYSCIKKLMRHFYA